MAKRLITQEDVFSAARELVAAGEKPSTLSIHKHLGRGSYSTIQKCLKAWESTDEAAEAQIDELPAVNDVPESLTQDVTLLLKKVWTAAKTMADEQIAQEREALAQMQAEAEKSKQEAIDYADQLSSANEALEYQLATALTQNSHLNEGMRDLHSQLDSLTKDKEALTGSLSSANEQLEVMAESLAEQKTENTLLSHTHTQLNSAVTELTAQNKVLSHSLTSAKESQITAESELKSATETIDALRSEHAKANKALKAELKTDHNKAMKTLTDALARQHDKAIADVRAERDALTAKMDTMIEQRNQ